MVNVMQRTERQCSCNVLNSFADGMVCSSHPMLSTERDLLRLHFYIDDFEVCNPIGSHRGKHKHTAVYFLLGNIDVRHWSNTDNIHMCILANAADVKKYGLSQVMQPLIDDLKVLQQRGLDVNRKTFHGFMATFSADNLASHQIGGFREYFSSGNICRFCTVLHKDIKNHVNESNCVVRTATLHSNHVACVTKDPTLANVCGVKSVSVLHNVPYFDVTCGLPPDVMHDVLEGLIPLNIKVVLSNFIKTRLITVRKFNYRLQSFQFNSCDKGSRPCPLPEDFATSQKLNGSASENLCLFRYLPFIIGDSIHEENDFWLLHLLCRRICAIVLAHSATEEWCALLEDLIVRHHTLFLRLAPDKFTPKMHFVIHYPRLIMLFGPLRYMWSMRFEACHQYFKKNAKVAGNFKNVSVTVAEWYQFKKCWKMSSNNGFRDSYVVQGGQNELAIMNLPLAFRNILCNVLSLQQSDKVLSVRYVVAESRDMRLNDFWIVDFVHDEAIPLFINSELYTLE
jgi:hypothetical protein